MLIAANCIEMAAVARIFEDEAHDQREDDENDYRIGDAESLAAADFDEQVPVRPEFMEELVVGYGERETPPDTQHAKGNNEGRQSPVGDEIAVDRADQDSCYNAG